MGKKGMSKEEKAAAALKYLQDEKKPLYVIHPFIYIILHTLITQFNQ